VNWEQMSDVFDVKRRSLEERSLEERSLEEWRK
jgi:hypothetical protein